MHVYVPAVVYLLCFATSGACALLLWRSYIRTSAPLLLWSMLCFLLLAANNLMVIIDLVILPDADFSIVRLLLALSAVSVLLFGFIWNVEAE